MLRNCILWLYRLQIRINNVVPQPKIFYLNLYSNDELPFKHIQAIYNLKLATEVVKYMFNYAY